jgi:TPR repeat protein
MYGLGNCYLYAVGKARDLHEARHWYEQALAGGYDAAQQAIDSVDYYEAHPDYTPDDRADTN